MKEQHPVDRDAATQVGQVIQHLSKMTQRLPAPRIRPRVPGHQRIPATPERMSALLDALGDPQHPDHAKAIDAFVSIGPPAVPLLSDALRAQQPWLTAYRAAEALGYIGDGRAVSALIQALRHPNSNVRWSAVRALAQIGDLRAMFELNRLVHEDHGRTSWGESVAGTAQSALEQMRGRSVWGQSIELIKTAITSILMILALILAFSVITTLSSELEMVGIAREGAPRIVPPAPVVTPQIDAQQGEPAPLALTNPTLEPAESAAATTTPTPATTEAVAGTVLQGANARPFPSTQNQPIGELNQGDEIIFLARNTSGDWYLVRLGERHSENSSINNPNGSAAGWVNEALLSEPEGEVPVENPDGTIDPPQPTATSSATPTGTPTT